MKGEGQKDERKLWNVLRVTRNLGLELSPRGPLGDDRDILKHNNWNWT